METLLSNISYQTSVLQCVIHTPELLQEIFYKQQGEFILEFVKMMKNFHNSDKKIIEIIKFMKTVGYFSTKINKLQQQDAYDFLNILLNDITKYSKLNDNNLDPSFNCRIESLLNCNKIDSDSKKDLENILFKCLSVEIPTILEQERIPSINDCLNFFFKNKYNFIDGCNFFQIENELRISSLPQNLIIHVKRFNNKEMKNKNYIHINEFLDLKKFLIEKLQNENLETRYYLYGVCQNLGDSLNRGYYTADYRENNNSKWYHFDNENVKEIQKYNRFCDLSYILFYRIFKGNHNEEVLKDD